GRGEDAGVGNEEGEGKVAFDDVGSCWIQGVETYLGDDAHRPQRVPRVVCGDADAAARITEVGSAAAILDAVRLVGGVVAATVGVVFGFIEREALTSIAVMTDSYKHALSPLQDGKR